MEIRTNRDTWVNEFRKEKNYGDGRGYMLYDEPGPPMLFLGFSGTDEKIVLLGFDMNKGKVGAERVSKAILRVCCVYSGTEAPCTVEARPILEPWEEHTVTFATMPRLGNPVSAVTLKGMHRDPKWYEWDVTKIVNGWLAGKPNHGIALDPKGDKGVDRWIGARESREDREARLILTV